MKHFIILSFSLILLLTACNENDRMIDYEKLETSGNAHIYEVSNEVQSLIIENVPIDAKIYITKTNEGQNVIPKDKAQCVTSALGIYLNAKNSDSLKASSYITPSSDFTPPKTFTKHERLITFNPEEENREKRNKTLKEKKYSNNSQKNIYIDVNSEMSEYKERPAHLASQGTYCYVWIIDDYYSEKLQNSAEILSKEFDSMYMKIRKIFGKESDEMFCNYNGKYFETKPIEYVSETGKKINIILYDIGMKNNGVVGYFSSKDYFPRGKDYESRAIRHSNAGKYIYIDSQWAEADIDICSLTLAHEFQHMIQYKQKTLNYDLVPNDAFNEMMALLCEDILSEKNKNESLNSRLALFNRGYAECGLEYRGESHYHAMLSYAVAYTFGKWLFNNYGGTPLINSMATNSYVNIQAITNATQKSMEELLKQFSIFCACKTKDNSYMWNLHKTDYDADGYKYDGPLCYAFNAQHEIRPYGILLIKAGTAEDSTVAFKFTQKTFTKTEHTYIVIEP
ncbi:MAG: hypothetical protein K6G00_03585 [Treponema sp.]|nr:hypothetical protein [Treponema sp.]